MPDLTTVALNEAHPVFDQLVADWRRLQAVRAAAARWAASPTEPLPLVEAREVVRHRGLTRCEELFARVGELADRWPGGGDRLANLLQFAILSTAYLAVVVGLALAAR